MIGRVSVRHEVGPICHASTDDHMLAIPLGALSDPVLLRCGCTIRIEVTQ